MLDQGAEVDAEDDEGLTPLFTALCMANPDVAELLVNQGASVNVKDRIDGMTLLHDAARSGTIGNIEFLLLHGADINTKDNKGRTALDWAIQRGHKECAQFLLEQGAKRNTMEISG